jgi:para-nitrobenzyl esterase
MRISQRSIGLERFSNGDTPPPNTSSFWRSQNLRICPLSAVSTFTRNALAASFCLLVSSAHAANPLIVKTDQGKVQGAMASSPEVRAFKGIPYAAPPVGDLRWKEPQPAAPWKGVRTATDFGSHCVQTGGYPDMVFHDPGASEDCLTLNVWSPVNAKPGKLPVMVWIYGGGYTTGGTSEARQNGEFLARRGVVVVSMNYRLGIFGFFAHPELTAESPHHASGNYGLMDQNAVLQWVRRNIATFGGDPANVTIFGESAGSFSVSTQMASPLSKGLIAKAIGESGGSFSNSGLASDSREQTEVRDVKFAQAAFGTSDLARLRKVSPDDLVKAARAKTPPAPRFGPDVDGYFLPDSVPNIYAAGKQAHIPLIAGWNTGEAQSQVVLSPKKTTAESFTAQAQKEYGDNADKFLALYPAASDEQAVQSAIDLAGDRFIAHSTWLWLEAHVKTGQAPTYRYLFALGSPGDTNHAAALGAFHSDDIEYVFGTLDSRPGAVWRPEDRKLSDQMGQYWTNFAKTGNPNGAGLPEWPPYAPKKFMYMRLDSTSEAKPDTYRERHLFQTATVPNL